MHEVSSDLSGRLLRIVYVRLDDALAMLWGDNPKEHDMGAMADSIRRYGFRDASIYDAALPGIAAGNGRLQALAHLRQYDPHLDIPGIARTPDGTWCVPIQFGLDSSSQDVARAFAVDHNNLTMAGGSFTAEDMARMWDETYTDLLLSLAMNDQLPITVDGDDLDALLDQLSDDDAEDDDGEYVGEYSAERGAELLAKWNVSRGQVWELPSLTMSNVSHRIMCGDSTSLEDVSRLMGGRAWRTVVTSPPYDDQREYQLGSFDWASLMNAVFDTLIATSGSPCDMAVNLGLSHKNGRVHFYWDAWLDHMDARGWPLYGWYVWDKGAGFPGEWNGRLAPAHEFIFHFNVGRVSARKWVETTDDSAKRNPKAYRFRQPDGSFKPADSPESFGQTHKIPDSVIRVGREMARGVHTQVHPAVYPVEFAASLIRTWSDELDPILDPFAGSGTTLLAAERTSRVGYGMEIEPSYVAAILERFSEQGFEPRLMVVQHGD